MNFLDVFHENLSKHPEKALVTEVRGDVLAPFSGRELARLVGKARAVLRARGVVPGDRVVLLAPNGARWIAADLAMLFEGAIVVPMYARQDPAELVWMMRDCDPRTVVVADEALAASVRAHWTDAPLVTFEALFGGSAEVSEPPLPRAPEDPTTIIYTSGTSGHPKGVVLSRRNVDVMLPVTRDALGRLMGPREGDDRVFHYLPFCFAGSRIVLFTCLFRANGIMISTDLNDLAREIGSAKPHYFLNVPALLERIKNGVEAKIASQKAPIRALYARGKAAFARRIRGEGNVADALAASVARKIIFDKIRKQIGPNLECLICGSAPLGEDTQRFFEMLGIPVYQVYGLTETTAIVTMDEPRAAIPGRVGHAIPGCEIRLTDEGELLVRGTNVFGGYWNRPEATAEVFSGEWFHTGDQAEIDGSGNVRIIGRVKNLLVPTSGHNVAPEPIEQKLVERTPGAEHAVVIGHGRPHLTAIVSGKVERGAVEKVIDELNAEMPHYRRIRAFAIVDESLTPENGLLTANQKLKRKAIEAHFAAVIDGLYGKTATTAAEARV